MRPHGFLLLHGQLLEILATIGHGESLVICDAGLPIPKNQLLIDLAVSPNLPRFLDVLRVVVAEFVVESMIVASETLNNHPLALGIRELVSAKEIVVPHDALKDRIPVARAAVRTGEFTPYANIILVGGIPFDVSPKYSETHCQEF